MTENKFCSQLKSGTIVDHARSEIHDLITKLETQIEANYKEAYLQGEKLGKEEADSIDLGIEEKKSTFLSEMVSNIQPQALELARALLVKEVMLFPDSVVRIALKAAPFASEASRICLRINPADEYVLKAHKSEIAESFEKVSDFDIKLDLGIERGGLQIQTELGIIDAQIKTQLEEISGIRLLETNV